MKIQQAREQFLSHLDLERGYSALTVSSYRSDFRVFLRYLKETEQQAVLGNVDRQRIRQYIAWLRKHGRKPNSMPRQLNSLRSFWNYLRDNGYTQRDPFLGISVPKRATLAPVYLSAQECEALLEATERQPSVFKAFRDKAILSVLIFTGIRRAELLALQLDAVDLAQGTLRVQQRKGRKARLLTSGPQGPDGCLAAGSAKLWCEA